MLMTTEKFCEAKTLTAISQPKNIKLNCFNANNIINKSPVLIKTEDEIMKLRSGFETATLADLMEKASKMLMSFKRIPSKNPMSDGTRKNVLPSGQDRIQAFTLGKVRAYHQIEMMNSSNNRTLKYKPLHLLLKQIIHKFNPNFKFTTIQINKNVKCPAHRDKNNVGASIALGLGDYTGGGIEQYEEDGSITYLDNHNKCVYQDGSLLHKTADWVGTRYAIIFFYHQGSLKENNDTREEIQHTLALKNEIEGDYKIAIPSYKRAGKKQFKTLPYLASIGVPPQDIYLFVHKKEYGEYQELYGHQAKIISVDYDTDKGGIVRIHNYITRYFREGENLLCMDDDVSGIYKSMPSVDGKFIKQKITNKKLFKSFTKHHFNLLRKNNISLCGLYPVDNAMFMYNQKEYNYGNEWVMGCCYFTTNKRSVVLTEEFWCKEEVERSILHFPSLRSNKYCFRTTYYAPGGITATGRNDEVEKECATKLYEMYPDNFTKIFQRKNGKWDLKLKKISIDFQPTFLETALN